MGGPAKSDDAFLKLSNGYNYFREFIVRLTPYCNDIKLNKKNLPLEMILPRKVLGGNVLNFSCNMSRMTCGFGNGHCFPVEELYI